MTFYDIPVFLYNGKPGYAPACARPVMKTKKFWRHAVFLSELIVQGKKTVKLMNPTAAHFGNYIGQKRLALLEVIGNKTHQLFSFQPISETISGKNMFL